MYSPAYIWHKTVTHLKEKLTEEVVSQWFADAQLVELSDNHLILFAPAAAQREAIAENCRDLIETYLQEELHMKRRLLVLDEAGMEERKVLTPATWIQNLNRDYTLESFVTGTSNKFALGAATAVAEHDEHSGHATFNPLIIWGTPGVGKTHLLHAIANRILRKNPEAKVVYTNIDQYIGDAIYSSVKGATSIFREKYLEADILLVDDLQFFAGNRAAQEAFFHTIHHLYQRGKRVVLASNRRLEDMPVLEEQLKRHCDFLLVANIAAPDPDTRREIIRKKAAELRLPLTETMVYILAHKLSGNVRQIEGGLHKLQAYMELAGMELTMPNIAHAVADVQTERELLGF